MVGSFDTGGTDCAIVLPDENLLKPVLNSIPEEIRDINVTMGLPMKASSLYVMMSDLASVQLHAVKKKDKWHFYHKHLWDLFASEIFRSAADEQTMAVVAQVKRDAKYYVPADELAGTPLLDALFRPVITDPKARSKEQIDSFAGYQMEVLKTVAPALAKDPSLALELEYAKEYYQSISIIRQIALDILPATYIRLLNQLLGSVSVPFRGEPLKGLQIMGPLETRALDFRNLVIMQP